jgi:hypothetical protein
VTPTAILRPRFFRGAVGGIAGYAGMVAAFHIPGAAART